MNEEAKDLNELLELLEKLKNEVNMEDSDIPGEEDFESLISKSFSDMDEEFKRESKTQILKVKKLNGDAVLPSYNYSGDSGFDLYSTEDITIEPFGRGLIPTGLSFEFDEGYEIQVRTKSGLAINQGLMVLNSPGTVDKGYTGEIKVPLFNVNNETKLIKKGMKVAQAVLCPVVNGGYVRIEEIENLKETERGSNGFGSTGI